MRQTPNTHVVTECSGRSATIPCQCQQCLAYYRVGDQLTGPGIYHETIIYRDQVQAEYMKATAEFETMSQERQIAEWENKRVSEEWERDLARHNNQMRYGQNFKPNREERRRIRSQTKKRQKLF